MRILVDIVHPADVLFFARPIGMWKARGDEVLVLSRHKDVTCDLLDEFGIDHWPITTASKGLIGLGSELLKRSYSTWLEARRFKPDVMVGFGGVSISHAGKLRGIPAVAFYDTEEATLQAKVTWPFIDHIFVPQSYDAPLPEGRYTRLPGVKELSYLHPAGFEPSRDTAVGAGLDPDRDNFLVRIVSWDANHDFGKTGWDENKLCQVLTELPGKVHLSSERPLPRDLEALRYRGKLSDIHHLMAFCRMVVGESATMTAEAAVLGVPVVFAGDFRGYIDDLSNAGLVQKSTIDDIVTTIHETLARDRQKQINLRDDFVSRSADWAVEVDKAVCRFAAS